MSKFNNERGESMISRYDIQSEEKIRSLLFDKVISIIKKEKPTVKDLIQLTLLIKLLLDVGNFCCSIYLSRSKSQSDASACSIIAQQKSTKN